MKFGWHTNTLDEVCIFRNGLWTGKVPPFISVGVIRNTNFTKEGILDESDIAFIQVEAKKYSSRGLNYGDIILEKSGGGPKQPVGRVVLFEKNDGEFSFSNFTSAITVRNKESLDFRFLHKYLYWIYLSGVTEGIQSNSTGIRNLDGNAYKSISIEYPSIVEQRRIVTILDEAFEGISIAKANAERSLNNARELFESYLRGILKVRGKNWQKARLGDIADVQSGGTPSRTKKEYWNGDIPWYSSGELNELFTQDPERKVTTEGINRSNAKQFPKGSLLIGMYDTAALKMSILDREGAFNQAIAGVKPNDKINLEFILHSINSQKPDLLLERRGVRQKNLSLGKIKDIVLPLPTVSEQKVIVEEIQAIQLVAKQLESNFRRKIQVLDELKKSLLHKAFSGAL